MVFLSAYIKFFLSKSMRLLFCKFGRRVLLIVFTGLCFSLGAGSQNSFANSATLKNIRIGGGGNNTRVVLDLTNLVEYKIFALSNPYRIVIDTNQFKSKLPAQINNKSSRAVKIIRYGVFKPGVSRTVLQLKYPAEIKKISTLKGKKPRLVIDLVKTSKKNYARQKTITSKKWGAIEKVSNKRQQDFIKSSLKPLTKKGKILIVIDAGHGGPDPGAVGLGGLFEKNVTLEIAKQLKKTLLKTGKFAVFLTRDKDFYVPLRTRYNIAESKNADFFISIHADKHPRKSVRGLSVYTLSEKSSDREAARLARKENLSDIIAGAKAPKENQIVNILIDISQAGTMNSSALLAEQLVKSAKMTKIELLRKPHRFAGFAVLKSPKVPSILVESGYMSNALDVKNLKDPKWHKKIAKAITNALILYFKKNPVN